MTKTWVLAAALIGTANLGRATNYYVSDCQAGADADCVAGNDANAGTDPAAPWRTFSKGGNKFGTMNAGDQVLLAKGGAFSGGVTVANMNCRGANPCVLADYTPPWASGDEGRPLITNPAGTVLSFLDGSGADADGGYAIRNIEFSGGGTNTKAAIWMLNDVDDVLMENLDVHGFIIGIDSNNSYAQQPYGPGANGHNDRIVLRDSHIHDNYGQGWIGGMEVGLIENNLFERNGSAGGPDHNIYLSKANDAIIRNNRLYKSSMVNGKCAGAPLVMHGESRRTLIEGNLIMEDEGAAADGCWGIAVDAGYPDSRPEGFRGTVIRGNTVVNVGNVSIGASGCPDCVVENNVVIHNQAEFPTSGVVMQESSDPPHPPEDEQDDNWTIRNNTVYIGPNSGIDTGSASTGVSTRGTNAGTSHVVTGNVVYYAGTKDNFRCYNHSLPAAAYELIDNNLCYSPNTGTTRFAGSSALAAWQAATGFDMNSKVGNPQFFDLTGGDFRLQPGSPAVNAGHPSLSAPTDFLGAVRGPAPDMGAYESDGLPPDAMPPARPRGLRRRAS